MYSNLKNKKLVAIWYGTFNDDYEDEISMAENPQKIVEFIDDHNCCEFKVIIDDDEDDL